MTDVDKVNKSYQCDFFFLHVHFYVCMELKPLQQRNDLLDYRKTNTDAQVHKKINFEPHKP